MKREYPETPIVGVGAIILDEGRVALVKRAHEPSRGEWSIPGGAIELAETTVDAIRREAFEETSLEVQPIALLSVFDRIIRDSADAILYHYVLIDYLCTRIAGDLRGGSDCDQARWFTRDEVIRLCLPKDAAEVIQMGFERVETRSMKKKSPGRPSTEFM